MVFNAFAAAQTASLVATDPNPDAPEAVQQFGQLQGNWSCLGSSRQPDGSWKPGEHPATWSWYYVLDGFAVQDVWKPGNPNGAMGTNLRTYDPESQSWNMVWATTGQARFDHFTASYEDGNLVMRGERWARAAFQAHDSRITFHNIGAQHFDWKYETAALQGEQQWNEISRIACDRSG